MVIRKGTLVEIEKLNIGNVKFPSKIIIIGKSLSNCEIGDIIDVKTISGHISRGVVYRTKSYYDTHQKGTKEILFIRQRKK